MALLITARVNIYQAKKSIPIVTKTCFSEGKLTKQFGNPPFLREPPLLTNPPISEQFFHDPPLSPNFKNKKPPPNFRGGGNCGNIRSIFKKIRKMFT